MTDTDAPIPPDADTSEEPANDPVPDDGDGETTPGLEPD